MTTPRTIDECYKRLGLTHRPTHLEMVTTEKLKEMVRKAWNFATAAERKRMRELENRKETTGEQQKRRTNSERPTRAIRSQREQRNRHSC
jgi:hypothetical protein